MRRSWVRIPELAPSLKSRKANALRGFALALIERRDMSLLGNSRGANQSPDDEVARDFLNLRRQGGDLGLQLADSGFHLGNRLDLGIQRCGSPGQTVNRLVEGQSSFIEGVYGCVKGGGPGIQNF